MLQHLSYIPSLLQNFERLLGSPRSSRQVVAVSGGLDSMVLLFLLHHFGYEVVVVHVNYKTRGEDSEADQLLVQTTAEKYGAKCYVFDGGGIQFMEGNFQKNAREFRYQKLIEVMALEETKSIVTAHHYNDDLETFLFKLIRNSYLLVPTGIAEVNGNVCRPLLAMRKEQLKELAEGFGVQWREDSSNQSLDYTRNAIRSRVLPEIERIHPIPYERIKKKHSLLQGFLQEQLEIQAKAYIIKEEESIRISSTILEHPYRELVLEYILVPTDFYGRMEEVLRLFYAQNGKQLLSGSQMMVKEREGVLWQRKYNSTEEYIEINPPFENSEVEVWLEDFRGEIRGGDREACIDAEKLLFPLVWRNVREGDAMQPLGMKGKKKISDILIGQKKELAEKRSSRVLLSGNEILWLSGFRVAEPFRVHTETKKILIIRLK